MGCFNSCGLWEVRVRGRDSVNRGMPKAQRPVNVPVPLTNGKNGTFQLESWILNGPPSHWLLVQRRASGHRRIWIRLHFGIFSCESKVLFEGQCFPISIHVRQVLKVFKVTLWIPSSLSWRKLDGKINTTQSIRLLWRYELASLV